MLTNASVYPTIPVTDMNRAKDFYTNTLGLKLDDKSEPAGVVFKAGNTKLYIYQRGPSRADHTLASFDVDNLEQTINELSQKGIVFEQYDIPEMGLKTDEKGIAVQGSVKGAWFKDPDGNILAISQMTK